MEKKQKRRKEKGITLVALVVTIIVLIILAGVTLNIVLDQNGIINKAQQATEDYDTAQREEQELLGVVEDYIEYAGKTAPIPGGYTVSQITTEDDVAEGLVIYEIPEGATVDWENQTITIEGSTTNLQQTVDQYVWIPVDDINSMVMCKSNSGDSVCNLVYDKSTNTLTCTNPDHLDTATELVGRLYTSSFVNTGNNIYSETMDFTKRDQTYEDDSGLREPDDLTATDAGDASSRGIAAIKEILGNDTASTYDEIKDEWNNLLKEDFRKMATSVAKNGGFYISRYEVGANGGSKKGQQVLTEGSGNEGNSLGANMWYGLFNILRDINNNQQMIWGCQYDQVIKFIGEEAQIGHSDRNLTTSAALTGQNELDKMKNIYDLEGNCYEVTSEAEVTRTRLVRGGGFDIISGGFFPASVRLVMLANPPVASNLNITTSRSTLY